MIRQKHIILLLLIPLALLPLACNQSTGPHSNAGVDEIPATFNLTDLKHRTFNFFWQESDPITGLIADRAPAKSFASIASTGFGITAYLIGIENGFISREEAAARILHLLKTLIELPQGPEISGTSGYKGFFYHFLKMHSGERYKDVELSTVDTAWLIAGILSAMEYFDADSEQEKQIRSLSDSLYRRVEWDWFLNTTPALSMGWNPGKGFLKSEWLGYNEAMALLIMALGSPTHPIPQVCWDKWTATYDWGNFYGYDMVNFGPLFGHQYSHLYIDFRGIQDEYMKEKGIDYFENSRRATLANRAYCMDNPLHFKDYSDTIWGLTACDGPGYSIQVYNGEKREFLGYSARGATIGHAVDDGTIAPTAAGGSIAFAPDTCLQALKAMYEKYGKKLYGKYGFRDAFNPSFTFGKGNEEGWFDPDYLGIDEGPILIMMENYQTGFVWNLMKKNKYIREGLKKAGFTGGWLE
jgi:hypothetical protein